jgi:hypothetical protein
VPDGGTSGERFAFHPIVEKLTTGGGGPTKFRLVRGYLGPGPSPNTVRLYPDLSLSKYVELSADSIHHVEDPPGSKLSPSWVWINADSSVTTNVSASHTLDSLFTGPIATNFLQRSVSQSRPIGLMADSVVGFCNTNTDIYCCPGRTEMLQCPTQGGC